jgi:polyisoprenoid-binding protein YceI
MKKTLIAAAFASLLAAPAFAAPVTYTIDSTHTYPRFSYTHMGFSKQLQRFDHTTGTVVLDKEAKTAKVDVTIDTTTVDSGYPTFNGHLQGAEFFDTKQFPTATFKSTKVNFKGDTPVSIEGNLTLKGITKPVTLTITSFTSQPHPMLKKDAIGANATAVIKRSDFNMSKFVPAVSDEVTLDIALEAIAN